MTREEIVRIQSKQELPESWKAFALAMPHPSMITIEGLYFSCTLPLPIEISAYEADDIQMIAIEGESDADISVYMRRHRLTVETTL